MIAERLTAERLAAQLLAGEPARDPVAVAERLLAVQAQDPRGARLAVRARTAGLTAADVDRALTEDRSLVVTWLNRGTLHLVRSEDYPWLHALTAPRLFTGCRRRLAQLGVEPPAADRAVQVIERALAAEGPLTRLPLGDRIASAGVRTEGQALVHLLFLASLRGIAVRGPLAGREQAYSLARDWLGTQPPVDRDAALAELARRYLAGHGPASDRDLARWAGLPLGDARAAFGAIAAELEERGGALVSLARRPSPGELPPPRLLGPYEPLLLGWTARDWVLPARSDRVVSGGLFRAFALVEGRAAATWRLVSGDLELDPLVRLTRRDADALAADSRRVAQFLGA